MKPVVTKYFVLTKMDVSEEPEKKAIETPGAGDLMQRLGGKGGDVPFFAFLDSRGEMIGNSVAPARDGHEAGNIGDPYEPYEVDYFMSLLAKAAPEMTAEERGRIEKPLRAQKTEKK